MSSTVQASTITSFDPRSFRTFRFIGRRIDLYQPEAKASVTLRYGLDRLEFEETFTLPLPQRALSDPGARDPRAQDAGVQESGTEDQLGRVITGLLDLLHWVAGVSYYKAAVPPAISFESGSVSGPATLALLKALYSEGLGEFAVVNHLPGLPRPRFIPSTGAPKPMCGSNSSTPREPTRPAALLDAAAGPRGSNSSTPREPTRPAAAPTEASGSPASQLSSLLVPVGGGKDSAVAIEIARAAGLDVTLFSVGDAGPIRATSELAGYPRLIVTRRIDPRLLEANAKGALNGHVPITAIVSCVALLTAALHGLDAVALANERSASAGNLTWHGVQVNHQFSKSLHAERLLSAAVAEIPGGAALSGDAALPGPSALGASVSAAPTVFSLLRPASEICIARAFARYNRYHRAFTSCNRVFRLDPARRTSSWCCDCDKCRFVYLILAPFIDPARLTAIFGADLLAEPGQYDGFALLTATGGAKPFECVGEVDECLAAIRLLSESPVWRDHAVVKRLATEVLAQRPVSDAQLEAHFALSTEHQVPNRLLSAAREVLGGDGAGVPLKGAQQQ